MTKNNQQSISVIIFSIILLLISISSLVLSVLQYTKRKPNDNQKSKFQISESNEPNEIEAKIINIYNTDSKSALETPRMNIESTSSNISSTIQSIDIQKQNGKMIYNDTSFKSLFYINYFEFKGLLNNTVQSSDFVDKIQILENTGLQVPFTSINNSSISVIDTKNIGFGNCYDRFNENDDIKIEYILQYKNGFCNFYVKKYKNEELFSDFYYDSSPNILVLSLSNTVAKNVTVDFIIENSFNDFIKSLHGLVVTHYYFSNIVNNLIFNVKSQSVNFNIKVSSTINYNNPKTEIIPKNTEKQVTIGNTLYCSSDGQKIIGNIQDTTLSFFVKNENLYIYFYGYNY